jgi:beta-1,4-mannosyl-glycoprotein beta-1,4-N-acetylglucosaminyltransferase
MKLIDTFLFLNEIDLAEFRIRYLSDAVDLFVVVEYDETFSGIKKPSYQFKSVIDRLPLDVIKRVHYVKLSMKKYNSGVQLIDDHRVTDPNKIYEHKHNGIKKLNDLSECFIREVYQRDSLILALREVALAEDLVMINDLDEIPRLEILFGINRLFDQLNHINLSMNWFLYDLNHIKKQEWFGTRICTYKHLDNKSIDLMRYNLEIREKQVGIIIENAGWHLSSMGGVSKVKEKMLAYDYQGRRFRSIYRILDKFFKNRLRWFVNNGYDSYSSEKLATINPREFFPENFIRVALKTKLYDNC